MYKKIASKFLVLYKVLCNLFTNDRLMMAKSNIYMIILTLCQKLMEVQNLLEIFIWFLIFFTIKMNRFKDSFPLEIKFEISNNNVNPKSFYTFNFYS